MKHYLFIPILFLATTISAQIKDTRAVLDIHGRVNEISVSPDEKIWLTTAVGNTYYANSIDSNWYYGKSFYQSVYSHENPSLDRISFFNTDTAIMTGYICGKKEEYKKTGVFLTKKNGLYITKDGGRSWELVNFGNGSWIYNVFVDKTGKAWMGGSSGEILYSEDFGQHWEKLNSPYNSSSRMHYIFMENETNGISGASYSKIYTTANNWKTYEKINAPFPPQKKIFGSDIKKVLYWKNFIVVNQNRHIFYSDRNKIEWKRFPIKIIDFELDNDSKELFAITDSLKIVLFSSPTDFITLSDKQLLGYPIDMKVVNHSLYIVCNRRFIESRYEIYKVNKQEMIRSIPYTSDRKIAQPNIIKKGEKITWGISNNQIYLSDTQNDWYRENALKFDIENITLLDDSTAILWNGEDNYLYSLQNRTPVIYYPKNPLKDFFSSPIKSLSINAGISGCSGRSYDEIFYNRINDSILTTTKFTSNKRSSNSDTLFKNEINSNLLKTILLSIDSNPDKMPSLSDFLITEKDKKNYLTLIDWHLKDTKRFYKNRKFKPNKDFYYSIPLIIDTLNDTVLHTLLKRREDVWSTGKNWITIQIVNNNNDVITISRNYYSFSYPPCSLPWKFEYKETTFNSYEIKLSQYINSCLPQNFMHKEIFENTFLFMMIENYLRDLNK